MALLTSIFSKLLGDSSKIIDEVVTSQEEKLVLKNQLEKIINENRSIIEQEVTKRWQSDMQSDSWFQVEDKWVDLLQIVLITVIGAYFGSRGLEKINNGKQ